MIIAFGQVSKLALGAVPEHCYETESSQLSGLLSSSNLILFAYNSIPSKA